MSLRPGGHHSSGGTPPDPRRPGTPAWRILRTSAWIEGKLFLREPMTVAFALALPLLFLFVLGGVFGNTPDADIYGGHGPLDFYVPAYLGLVWAAVGLLALPVHLARYREDGVLRRLHASAAPRWTVLGAQGIVSLAIALVGAVLLIAAAALVYDIHAPRSPWGVAAAWLLAGMVFISLGILLGCVPTSRGALGAGLGLFFVMMMLGGAGPPFEVMTSVMRHVSDLLPLTYVNRVLQAPWLGTALAWGDVAVAAGIALASGIAAWAAFRRE
ncbi:MAG: ABC transporter permease [Micromonosporaceae bacterium]